MYDQPLCRSWHRRAVAARLPQRVLVAHRRSCARLGLVPRTPIHGDAYASNIIVRRAPCRLEPEVWFIDWELIGIGPAVLDVAALVAGSWSQTAVESMARAYFDATTELHGGGQSWDDWIRDLTAARLYVCVQWLCWSREWEAPEAHRHDWLAEAERIAQRI
jgi:thiamine kinase-like enzyme